MSSSALRKLVLAAMFVGVAGTGIALALTAPSAETAGLDLDAEARTRAVEAWQAHLRKIGWPEEMVVATRPEFLQHISDKAPAGAGSWSFVFDGSSTHEQRVVTLTLASDGVLLGEPEIQWADLMVAGE